MKVKLEIVTPIHIGDGNEYMPFDYVIEGSKFKVINKLKFQEKIASDEKMYEEFCDISENTEKAIGFIRNYADSFIYEAEVSEEARSDLIVTSKNIRRPVATFIKDKFLNTPIIPGSSVKGAIRTAVFNHVYQKMKYNEVKKGKYLKECLLKEIEAVIFCAAKPNKKEEIKHNAREDLFKALYVSDFKPVNYRLKVIKPLNKGTKPEFNKLPVILEVLESGEFEGEIRIDERLLGSLEANKHFELSIDNLKQVIEEFYSKVNTIERNKKAWEAVRIPAYESYMMKIGKHSGAGCKTIRDDEKVRIYIRTLKKSFSYQLSTWCDANRVQIGWIKLVF